MNCRLSRMVMVVTCVVMLCTSTRSAETEHDGYLTASEGLAIGAAGAATWGLGQFVKRSGEDRASLIRGPLPSERSLQQFLGGKYYAGKTNFLDDTFGSAVTPIVGAVALTVNNATYPRDAELKDVSQDLTLYISGLLATKGVTDLFKGTFKRPRPLVAMHPEESAGYAHLSKRYRRESFFSGHASSAFFSMAFLNKRLRETMRRESPDSYGDWNWAPPVVCFGWATFVGWSRLHSYKHYLSDVIVGAAAGWLLAELFYSLDDVSRRTNGSAAAGGGIYFSWSFRL